MRNVILALVAVGLLVLAVFLYRSLSQPEAAPDDQFVSFYCPECKQGFKLSHREFEKLWDNKEYRQVGGREVLYKCPMCGKIVAERTDEPGGSEAPAAE